MLAHGSRVISDSVKRVRNCSLKAKVEIQQAIARKEQRMISRVKLALLAVVGVAVAFAGVFSIFTNYDF